MTRLSLLIPTIAALFLMGQPAVALELSDCRISAGPSFPSMKARCGTLARPENPDDPASGTIDLRVVVVPALNLKPLPDPVVPLAGGPGQGAVQFYTFYSRAFENLRRDRDILLVDQRGTGESALMDCPVDLAELEGDYSIDETVQFMRDCLEQLPHDPRYFTTSVAVEDLEAVREALGYPTLNVYGVSYGSRMAQHYARRFPDTTRTIMLDGVVPPQLPLGPDIAIEAQKALDNIFARCAEDEACNERFPDLAEDFEKLKRRLDKTPVNVDAAHPVTGEVESVRFGREQLAASIRLNAYSPSSIAMLPLLISEAVNGNYAPLVAQYQMTVMNISEALALGMHNSIMCTEDVPFYAPESFDQTALEASYMGPMQIEALQAICSVWPTGPIDEGFREPLSTDIPTLLLSGSADPITPPAYADMAARHLKRAWLLTGEHQGHGQLAVGCMPRIVEQFVTNAGLENVDASCMQSSFVMPFFLGFSGPNP